MSYRKNGYGNFYGKRIYVNQNIYINQNQTSSKNYVSRKSIEALDKMIDELVIFENVIFNRSKDEVIKKYRGYIKNNFGDGSYSKLTPDNFEKAKAYLLKNLYALKDDFATILFNRIRELKPEQMILIYEKYLKVCE